VREHTGFDYDTPDHVPDTPAPDANTLALLRGEVADAVAERYPSFAAKVFSAANAA
jgi:glutaconate CoA-transferase subunit B